MDLELRPNTAEIEFLNLAYNRFYDLFEEVLADSFWEKDEYYRFSKVRDGFAVYSELLNYTPIKWILEHMEKSRPPMESKIGSELFKIIRNIFAHFPFFESWNDVWINKPIINWFKEGLSIDKFFREYQGKGIVKYRFWEQEKRKMTYVSINFPKVYDDKTKIFLKDIITEKEGIKFCFILMKKILDTQVESID